jgi:hypothetical protein
MPKIPLVGKVGPLGLALTIYDVYRRLPPKQRRMVLQMTRAHGPRLAAKAMRAGTDAARRRRRP